MYTPGDKEPSDPFWSCVKNLFQARAREKEARRRRIARLNTVFLLFFIVFELAFLATLALWIEGKQITLEAYLGLAVAFWGAFVAFLDHAVGAFVVFLFATGVTGAVVRAFRRPGEEGFRRLFLAVWTVFLVAAFVAAGYAFGDDAPRATVLVSRVPRGIAQVSENEIVSGAVQTAWKVVVALGELYGFIEFVGLARKALTRLTGGE